MNYKLNILFATIFYFVSFALLSGGAFALYQAGPAIFTAIQSDALGNDSLSRDCRASAVTLGLTASPTTDGRILVQQSVLVDPELTFGRASSLILACAGYQLDEFCAGNECADNFQFTMTLRRTPTF